MDTFAIHTLIWVKLANCGKYKITYTRFYHRKICISQNTSKLCSVGKDTNSIIHSKWLVLFKYHFS